MGLLNKNTNNIKSTIFYFNGLHLILKNLITVITYFSQSLFKKKSNIISLTIHLQNKQFKQQLNFINNTLFFFFDYINIIFKFFYLKISSNFTFNLRLKFKQLNHLKYLKNFNTSNSNFFYSYLYGFISLWNIFKFWMLGTFFFILIFYYLTYIRLLPINKVLFEWFLIVMFLYWLLSGFVFFYKKYQFSKYTSVIQRFWKRTYILFWIIESGVFLVYFYLTLNASEEPVYMYDQLKLYKTHFFSWRLFLIKLIPVTTLIISGYYIQLLLKWSFFGQQSFFILLLTLLLIFIFWIEFYQFFHILNFYGNLNWIFDYDEYTWNLELEFRRTRLANNYISICLIAKFWHLVFIFVFWIFFVLRINESKRIRYPLLAANVQNFIILYIMSWLYMYPWFKFIFKNFLENSFFWFMTNNRSLGLRLFFTELKIFTHSGLFNFLMPNNFHNFSYSFFYFFESSSEINFLQFKKHALKDFIISTINY